MSIMYTDQLLNLYANGQRVFKDINLRCRISNLESTQLSNIEIYGAIFHEVSLQDANLENAILQDIKFEYVNFQRVNLKKAILKELNLQNANLKSANLQEANLAHAQLQGAILQEVNLQKANLAAANLRGADLRGANISEANLRETNIEDILWDQNSICKSVKNIKRAICSNKDLISSLIFTQVKLGGELEYCIEVNGKNTLLTDKEAKEQIQKAINQRFTGRQGQSKFRKELLQAYKGHCAITGCDIEETLEAAHIVPYCLTKDNSVCNGLLLRADLHTLFDFNLICINPYTKVVEIDKQLQNSSIYYNLHRKTVELPSIQTENQKFIDALKWRYYDYQKFLDYQ